MENEKYSETKGHTHVQWISGIIGNSILFTYGMQAGWLSPSAKLLKSHSSPTGQLSDYTLGWIGSLMPITALLFAPLYAFLADRIGRKKCILLMTVPQLACWLLKVFATNLTCLVVARILYGVAAGGCFGVVPMYNKEIAQDDIRGRMGSMLIFSLNLGILSMYALGAYLDYYTVLYLVIPIPILSFLLMLGCPESPGYLVKVGQVDEAATNLSRLRGLPVNNKALQHELENMKKLDAYYKTLPNISFAVIYKHGVIDRSFQTGKVLLLAQIYSLTIHLWDNCHNAVKDKAWRKAYLIASLLITVQALSGNFALVTYGATILTAAGADMNAELQTLSFPVVMMLGSVVSLCVMERVRRKIILLISYVVSVLALGSLATVMLFPDSVPVWFLLLAITSAMFVYALGVLPGPYIVMSEIFNIQIRAKMMGAVVVQAWAMCFTQLAAFAPISAALGMHSYFYICATVNLLGIAVVLVLLPETRGKSIEEIEKELRGR